MAYSSDPSAPPGYFVNTHSRLFLLAVILLAVGSIITFIAISTPAWQVGYVAEYEQHLESGLWIFCERRPALGTACTYSITGDDYSTYQPQNYDFLKTPPFYPWHGHILRIFLAAIFLSCVCLVPGCMTIFFRWKTRCAVLFDILVVITIIVSICGIGVFFIMSSFVQYRFDIGVKSTYERTRGYSFYLAIVGVIFWIGSAVAGVFGTKFAFDDAANNNETSVKSPSTYLEMRPARSISDDFSQHVYKQEPTRVGASSAYYRR